MLLLKQRFDGIPKPSIKSVRWIFHRYSVSSPQKHKNRDLKNNADNVIYVYENKFISNTNWNGGLNDIYSVKTIFY